MCRVVTGQYRRNRHAATRARHQLGHALAEWHVDAEHGCGSVPDTAALLTSELVANAVVHARSPVRLAVAVADGALEVGVTDLDRRTPRIRREERQLVGLDESGGTRRGDPLTWVRQGGRGMRLVDALADEWGTARLVAGKQVWFRLAIPAWSYRVACRCSGDELDRVRLGSGRLVAATPPPWSLPSG